jgi:hypothetical protein
MVHPERAEVDEVTMVGVVKAEAEANRHARVKDRIIMVKKWRKAVNERNEEQRQLEGIPSNNVHCVTRFFV